jgi:thiol:disulfide interchange protein DsbA
MNRGVLFACALMAAAAIATLSVRACAEQPAKSEKPANASATPAAATSLSQWQEGTNYTVLPNPQAPGVQGKVVVSEIFWYGCGHCYALDPLLESWKAKKPEYVDFVRIPVIWGPVHRQHAKLYYTLLALGRGDLHSSVFDAIHMTGNPLAASTDEQARAMHFAFLKDHGITEKAFNDAYDSPQVAANVQRAEELTKTYLVGAVPTMIVNGKYSTGVSQAGGSGALLTLVNDLAASERQRR